MEGTLGRTDVLVTAGIERPFNPVGFLAVAAHVPLLTRATGSQLDYPVLVLLSWSR